MINFQLVHCKFSYSSDLTSEGAFSLQVQRSFLCYHFFSSKTHQQQIQQGFRYERLLNERLCQMIQFELKFADLGKISQESVIKRT